MKKTVFVALCATASLLADQISFVEYDLPLPAQSWSSLQEGDDNRLIGSVSLDGAEFFNAVSSTEEGHIPDIAEIGEGLKIPFPDQQVKATVLETSDNSLLYEWSASDEEGEVIHGWGRILCGNSGTVTLNYSTGQINKIEELRPVWVDVLKRAHRIEQAPASP